MRAPYLRIPAARNGGAVRVERGLLLPVARGALAQDGAATEAFDHGPWCVCRVHGVSSRRLLPWLAMTVFGCAGGNGVSVRERTVEARELSYTFGPVAPGWRPIHVEGNDAAWLDEQTRGTIHVDHTCERSQDTPLPALVNHLLLGFTAREFLTEETVPFDGREARHVVLRARLDGVPRMIELYVMKKDGCVFDLGYVAPLEHFEHGRPAFDAFVRGFRTLRSPLAHR